MEVFIVFKSFEFSEEDHSTDVMRVFRSKSDADEYCSDLSLIDGSPFCHYFVVSYKVY